MLIVDVICVVTAIFVATWFLNELKAKISVWKDANSNENQIEIIW
jgi:hypothetical protein